MKATLRYEERWRETPLLCRILLIIRFLFLCFFFCFSLQSFFVCLRKKERKRWCKQISRRDKGVLNFSKSTFHKLYLFWFLASCEFAFAFSSDASVCANYVWPFLYCFCDAFKTNNCALSLSLALLWPFSESLHVYAAVSLPLFNT